MGLLHILDRIDLSTRLLAKFAERLSAWKYADLVISNAAADRAWFLRMSVTAGVP